MINYYQPFLLPFLGSKRSSLPRSVKRYYYHSFEDALWDLLIKKRIRKGSAILLPSFYCMDVVDNIRLHGYTPEFYPVDNNFQIEESSLNKLIRQKNPMALILFHACGITNPLIKKSFIRHHQNIVIIEDSVQRLVNPSNVRLFGGHHFVIDSLRKVSPIPGSFIYGTTKGLSYIPQPFRITSYFLSSAYWFLSFRLIFTLSMLLQEAKLAVYAHTTMLKRHDNIIGDRMFPQRSPAFVGELTTWLNYKKIEDRKTRQVTLYTKLFPSLLHTHTLFYPIRIPKRDYSSLHVFPIGMKSVPEGFIEKLHKQNMAIWCKFEDSPWAQGRHVLYLPLGFHVSDMEIRYAMKTLRTVSG